MKIEQTCSDCGFVFVDESMIFFNCDDGVLRCDDCASKLPKSVECGSLNNLRESRIEQLRERLASNRKELRDLELRYDLSKSDEVVDAIAFVSSAQRRRGHAARALIRDVVGSPSLDSPILILNRLRMKIGQRANAVDNLVNSLDVMIDVLVDALHSDYVEEAEADANPPDLRDPDSYPTA